MRKVYLDTNILKFWSKSYIEIEESKELLWGNTKIKLLTKKFVEKDKISKRNKETEKDLIEDLKSLDGILLALKDIEFCINIETKLEIARLVSINSNIFSLLNLIDVESPIQYSRVISSNEDISNTELQINFLKNIKSKRFLEICAATVVKNSKHENQQFLDAWHFWCAEYNSCSYFVTMDYQLINLIKNSQSFISKTKIIRPIDLLENRGGVEIKGIVPFLPLRN